MGVGTGMRTLAITQNMSADGSIEFLGDWFDPSDATEDLNAEVMRQSEAEDVLLLGRQTFEDFRGYWPHQTDDQTGITEHLNRVHKVVVSSTLTDPDWDNSSVLGADWRDRVRALKEKDGGDIVVTGSLTLVPAVIEAGLVDEYHLVTHPVIAGGGKKLFGNVSEMRRVRHQDTKTFASGIVTLKYKRA